MVKKRVKQTDELKTVFRINNRLYKEPQIYPVFRLILRWC